METRAVKRSVIINAGAQDVWKVLTDPVEIKKFLFGTDVKTDWKEGGPINYSGLWKGREYADKGTILKIEPNKILEHTHWSSLSGTEDRPENYFRVIYELEEKENQTVLSVTQKGLMSKDSYDHSAENWQTVLDHIKQIVEKEVVTPPLVS